MLSEDVTFEAVVRRQITIRHLDDRMVPRTLGILYAWLK